MSAVVAHLGIAWLAVLLGAAVLRLARARTVTQRILALDVLTFVLIGLAALAAREDRRPFPLDAALALALLSFVATLAACRYHEDRRPFG